MTEPLKDLKSRFASAGPPGSGDPLRWSVPDPEQCYAAFVAAVGRARQAGESISDNGTTLLGRAPHVAPLAWSHSLFQPLSDDEISQLDRLCRRPVPTAYRWWLRKHNGLGLFVSALSLYGLRMSYVRSPAIRLPFDLSTPNVHERPPDAPPQAFFVGGYSQDGGFLIWLNVETEAVHLSTRTSAVSLYEWPTLPLMIASEAIRLNELYDELGRLKGIQD